jgi:hypothetical protein
MSFKEHVFQSISRVESLPRRKGGILELLFSDDAEDRQEATERLNASAMLWDYTQHLNSKTTAELQSVMPDTKFRHQLCWLLHSLLVLDIQSVYDGSELPDQTGPDLVARQFDKTHKGWIGTAIKGPQLYNQARQHLSEISSAQTDVNPPAESFRDPVSEQLRLATVKVIRKSSLHLIMGNILGAAAAYRYLKLALETSYEDVMAFTTRLHHNMSINLWIQYVVTWSRSVEVYLFFRPYRLASPNGMEKRRHLPVGEGEEDEEESEPRERPMDYLYPIMLCFASSPLALLDPVDRCSASRNLNPGKPGSYIHVSEPLNPPFSLCFKCIPRRFRKAALLVTSKT